MLNVNESEQFTNHPIFQPIWAPIIFVEIPNDDITELRAIRVGKSMTNSKAWDAARAAMDSRPDAAGMTVRRDGQSI
jgi:hypothetical protein